MDRDRPEAANNGAGSYSWNTTGVAPGNYYIGGYLYDNATSTPKYSHLTTAVTIAGIQTSAASTFALTGPASGSFNAGQPVPIGWTLANAPASGSVSLCYDVDTLWNGNEKWIEIGQKAANNGADSYSWDTTGVAPGNYYIGGYLYDNATSTPKILALDHGDYDCRHSSPRRRPLR